MDRDFYEIDREKSVAIMSGLICCSTVFTTTDIYAKDVTLDTEQPAITENVTSKSIQSIPQDKSWWSSAEYIYWWTKNNGSPPLLIAGPQQGSIPNTFTSPATGFIGLFTLTSTPINLNLNNATDVVFGNPIDSPSNSGGRFALGKWLSPTVGVEVSYLFMAKSSTNFAGSPDMSNSAIPFFDVTNDLQSSYPINMPLTTTLKHVFLNTTPGIFVHLFNTETSTSSLGNMSSSLSSSLQAADLNGLWSLNNDTTQPLALIGGFRFVQLNEDLNLSSSVTRQNDSTTLLEPALGIPGQQSFINNSTSDIFRQDNFRTRNNFFGAQLGGRGEYRVGSWSLFGSGQASIGNMRENVNVSGITNFDNTSIITPTKTILVAGVPLIVPTGDPNILTTTSSQEDSGLFAQPTNSGNHTQNVIAGVIQGDVKLRYYFSPTCNLSAGYTVMYLSSVVQPGEQIVNGINPESLNVPFTNFDTSQPKFQFRTTDYWAQGVNIGLNLRY